MNNLPSAPELPHQIASKYGLTKIRQILRPTPIAGPSKKPKKHGKVWRFFTWWWRHKRIRIAVILLLIASIVFLVSYPQTRYLMLNQAGVRSRASLLIQDSSTQLPLGKIKVSIGDQTVVTNSDGVAYFENVRLGKTTMVIFASGYDELKKDLIIGWGSNPLGNFSVQARGVERIITIVDYISGRPISGASVDSASSTYASDQNGKVSLRVMDPESSPLAIQVAANGYKTNKLDLDLQLSDVQSVKLVPSGQHVFVSKQSGKYDVVATELDGQNRRVLLGGSGLENPDIALVVSPDGRHAAVVSTKDNQRDSRGYLLQALTLIDIDTGNASTIEHAAQINLLTWRGPALVFSILDKDNARNQILAYNFDANSRTQLVDDNSIAAAIAVNDTIYYTTDPDKQDGVLAKINIDGSNQQTVMEGNIWSILRTTYSSLSIQKADGWLSYDTQSGKIENIAVPNKVFSAAYINNQANTFSAWAETKDGTQTLLVWDIQKQTGRTIYAHDGLSTPVRWVGNYIIYRVSNSSEMADYIVSPDGGQPIKLNDVSMTYGYAKIF